MRSPTPPIIRQASGADAARLARLRWDDSTEGGREIGQPFSQFCEDFAAFLVGALASGHWVVWLAEAEGEIVAHVYVRLIEMIPRPGRLGARWGYAAAAYTVPERRNRGIGSQLLRRVIAWAEEERLETLVLWPSERSVPFYERAGFRRSLDVLELQLQGNAT
ncbi:MAG TPA: GNAT family N-acetyltransferase [Chloroflexota bacterium]|jgi:GNAT superfamily N-acetyltransferase|nr:GNAT family N-acetyltransferase [Chloroflexota bacterium]